MNKMIVIILLFSSCTNKIVENKKNQEYFEGIISYQIEAISKNSEISDKELSDYVGATMVSYIKEGNSFSRKYDHSGNIVEERLFLNSEGQRYLSRRFTDTIYWYNCITSTDDYKVIGVKKVGTKKVLNYTCKGISMKAKKMEGQKQDYDFEYIFYSSKDFVVHPDLIYACADTFYLINQSYPISWEYENPSMEIKYLPIKIEPKDLSDSLFQIKEGVPLKELKQ